MMVSAHDIVTGGMVYLNVGFVVWLVLDGLGIIGDTVSERPLSSRALVLASALMILGWPVFVWSFVRGFVRSIPR